MPKFKLRNPLKSRKRRRKSGESKPIVILTRRQQEKLEKQLSKAVKNSFEDFLNKQKKSPSKSRTSKKGGRSKTSKKR